MVIVLIWIWGQSEQGCSYLGAGVYSRAQCLGHLSQEKAVLYQIYCNLIKAMLILIMDLKLNKQVIYSDHMQIFAGSCITNIFALGLEITIVE